MSQVVIQINGTQYRKMVGLKSLNSLVNFFKKTVDEYDEEIVELNKKLESINTRLKIANEQREKVNRLYLERKKELEELNSK